MTEESIIAALEFVPIPDVSAPPAADIPPPGRKYTDETVRGIGERIAAGVSFRRIAMDMGVSRSAIAGIAGRNGFKSIRNVGRAIKPVRPPAPKISCGRDSTARYHPKPPLLPPEDYAELAAEIVSAKPVGILGLENSHCRYPVSGEGEHTKFCGNERHGELPYCLGHCRIAYRRPGEIR